MSSGCVFVYNTASYDSLELFHTIQEAILRVKEVDHFPLLLVGFHTATDTSRQVSKSQGSRIAERYHCEFAEVCEPEEIVPILLNFAESIARSSSSNGNAESQNQRISERYMVRGLRLSAEAKPPCRLLLVTFLWGRRLSFAELVLENHF